LRFKILHHTLPCFETLEALYRSGVLVFNRGISKIFRRELVTL
jgi:hypothetical protein